MGTPLVGLGSVWDRFGAGLGSVWGRSGVGLGSVWGRCGVGVGSVWGRCGVGLGSAQRMRDEFDRLGFQRLLIAVQWSSWVPPARLLRPCWLVRIAIARPVAPRPSGPGRNWDEVVLRVLAGAPLAGRPSGRQDRRDGALPFRGLRAPSAGAQERRPAL